MKKEPPVKVIQHADKAPIPTEIIAQSIADISVGMKKIRDGKLSRLAVVLLLTHSSGCTQRQVKDVLNAMDDLAKIYLKP